MSFAGWKGKGEAAEEGGKDRGDVAIGSGSGDARRKAGVRTRIKRAAMHAAYRWKRHGVTRLGCRYFQPPLGPCQAWAQPAAFLQHAVHTIRHNSLVQLLPPHDRGVRGPDGPVVQLHAIAKEHPWRNWWVASSRASIATKQKGTCMRQPN